VWDNYLVDGGTLEAVVPPAVYKKLALPGKDNARSPLAVRDARREVVKHVEQHGIRVTGTIEQVAFNRFVIKVASPEQVALYIKYSGM
jgi:hypothetical protein